MFRSESTSIRIRFCDGFCEDSRLRELAVEALNPDREIRESSLVLIVVVLVLDLLGFCAEKRADLLGNYFVPLV
jgi:hypothetical protein